MGKTHFLKEWRELRGLSLRQVSERSKGRITHSGVAKIESGDQQYTENALTILADVYGVEPWVLLVVDPSKFE
jgi:transcriptional regulator with XRE-family HTH domain